MARRGVGWQGELDWTGWEAKADGLMHPIGPYVYCLLKERRRGKDKCEGIVGPLVARLSPTQD